MQSVFVFFVVFAISALSATPSAQANDTAFGGTGANPMPIKTKEIAMASENIVITSIPSQNAWKVECDFVFKNETNKAVKTEMGMPFPAVDPDSELWAPKGKKIPKTGEPLVWNFTTAVDGRSVKSKKTKVQPNPKYPELDYMMAYTWPIAFKANGTVKVRNTYLIGYTEDSTGQSHLNYILRTGGMWRGGKIGRSQLTVIMNDPGLVYPKSKPHEYYAKTTPEPFKVERTDSEIRIKWDLKKFEPKSDLNVSFYRRSMIAAHFLHEDDLRKLSKAQLRITRNKLYAIYGYRFKHAALQKRFEKEWWYQPNKNFSAANFSEDEREFLSEIRKIEKSKK